MIHYKGIIVFRFSLIELEIATGIVVADVFDHLTQELAVVRQQTLLHIVAQQVAENTTEVFMTRIAQERTAVGKHTNKATQQAKYRKSVHLTNHTVHLVVEPPA